MAIVKFQTIKSDMLPGPPGVQNFHNKIMVAGSTVQDLHYKVEATIRKLSRGWAGTQL